MPISSGIRAYQDSTTRGSRLVLSDEADTDAMAVSGRWIAAERPVRVVA